MFTVHFGSGFLYLHSKSVSTDSNISGSSTALLSGFVTFDVDQDLWICTTTLCVRTLREKSDLSSVA
jgi:hypothetical protein